MIEARGDRRPGDESPSLFESARFHARELASADVTRLQALFDANPEYFLAVNGRPPAPDEARLVFDEVPPSHLSHGRRWLAGVFGRDGALIGVVDVVSDLAARGVWHVALFLVATPLHGSGAASEIYRALEAWAHRSGAEWLRLGVVDGNGRAERFWEKQGYVEVRLRRGVDTGGMLNDVRVLVKPLGNAGIAEYLARVPRDRPDATLP